MPLPLNVRDEIRAANGFADAVQVPIYDNREPEDSVNFEDSPRGDQGFHEFYYALASTPGFSMVDPSTFGYNKHYIGVGVDSIITRMSDIGIVYRNRWHEENGVPSEMKACIKPTGKERDREELEIDVRSLRVAHNQRKMAQKFPSTPQGFIDTPADSMFVSSVGAVSRTGFHGVHIMKDIGAMVFHALSNDKMAKAPPTIYQNVRRGNIVICGMHREGEVEGNDAYTINPDFIGKDGIVGKEASNAIYNESLSRIFNHVHSAGLPTIKSTMNKIESADASVREYYESKYASADGRITALAQGMLPRDYVRSYMREGVKRLFDHLPVAGSLLPSDLGKRVIVPGRTLEIA